MLKKGQNKQNRDDVVAGVYTIPCKNCDKVYIGETFRGLKTRIREHKYDMQCYNTNNAIVNHRLDTGHTADWDNSKIIKYENDTLTRRCYESAYIATRNNFNQNKGFITIAKPLAFLLTSNEPD